MSSENVELVREALRAFNRRDVEWAIAHSTPDCEWFPAVAAGVEGKPFRGPDGAREFFKGMVEVWEEFSLEPEELRDLGDHVLLLCQVHAKGKTGVVFEQSLDAVWEVRDGKFAKGRSYLDRDEALQAAAEVAAQEVRE
jgi:ketosteroid isomerase-like protein